MRFLLPVAVAFAAMTQAQAADVTYVAKLSLEDHYNSSGKQLKDAASIIRQDRANVHKFNQADDFDEVDNLFDSVKARGKIARMLKNGDTSKKVMDAIVHGTPEVIVYVSGNSMTVDLL